MIRRLMAGLGLSSCIILVSILGQLLAVPVCLTYWGPEVYGEWIVLTNLVASLSILNLGVQSYAGNLMISSYVRGEYQEGTEVLHAALRLYVIFCGFALLGVLFLVGWPGTLAWLKIKAISAVHARTIISIQGLLAVYAIVGGILMGLFRVINQYPRQLFYSLVERVIILGCPVVVAWLGGWPFEASLAIGFLMGTVAFVALRDVSRRTPYPIGLVKSSWKDALSLVRPSITFFGVSLAATILSTGMIVVISKILGALVVVIFSTTLMLTNLLRIVTQQGMNVLWPEITASAARSDDAGRLTRWHRLVLKLTTIFILVGSTGIWLLGPDILTIWTRGKIEVDFWLNFFLAVYLCIQAPALVSGVFGLATNRQAEMLFVQIVTAGISLVASCYLLLSLGVRGVAVALIIGQLVGTAWMLILACRWTSDHWSGLFEDFVLRGLFTFMIVVLGVIGLWYFSEGILGRILGFTCLGSVTGVVAWKTWFTESQRNLIREKITIRHFLPLSE